MELQRKKIASALALCAFLMPAIYGAETEPKDIEKFGTMQTPVLETIATKQAEKVAATDAKKRKARQKQVAEIRSRPAPTPKTITKEGLVTATGRKVGAEEERRKMLSRASDTYDFEKLNKIKGLLAQSVSGLKTKLRNRMDDELKVIKEKNTELNTIIKSLSERIEALRTNLKASEDFIAAQKKFVDAVFEEATEPVTEQGTQLPEEPPTKSDWGTSSASTDVGDLSDFDSEAGTSVAGKQAPVPTMLTKSQSHKKTSKRLAFGKLRNKSRRG
jgi:hypothetical protein